MALSVKAGSFAMRTTVGSQSVTGVGFQPSVILFASALRTAAGEEVYVANTFGAAESASARWGISSFSVDAAGTTATRQSARADRCLLSEDDSGAIIFYIDFTSMDADGFTINVTNAAGTAYLIQYLALAGSDLTNVSVGTFDLPTVGATTTVTGIGFQPDGVILANIGETTWPFDGDVLVTSMGGFTSTGQAASGTVDVDAVGTSDTNTWLRNDSVVLVSGAGDTQAVQASRNALNSDGFVLNMDNLPGASQTVGYVALKGAQVKVGTETSATSVTTKATTGAGFTPSAAMFWGGLQATSTTPAASARQFVGFDDGTNRLASACCSEDALDVTNVGRSFKTDRSLLKITGTPTVLSDGYVNSFDSDGFTANWTTADGVAGEFCYLLLGPAVSSMPPISAIGAIGV